MSGRRGGHQGKWGEALLRAPRGVAPGVAQARFQDIQLNMPGGSVVGAKECPLWVRRELYGCLDVGGLFEQEGVEEAGDHVDGRREEV